MPETEDLYKILNLHPSAHPDVIEAAYQRLTLLYHPDTDPSPEAAGLVAAISRAYAVLGNPEKRAAYDQNREAGENAPEAQAEGESTESDSPEARPRRRKKQSSADYITIGSRKDDVARIQGPPNSTSQYESSGEEQWSYPDVRVTFSRSGKVARWSVFSGDLGDLKIKMVPGPNATSSQFFSIYSHKDDVARLQGTPYRIDIEEAFNSETGRDGPVREIWRFSGGIIEFFVPTGRVTAWDNQDGSLKAQAMWEDHDAKWTGDDFFTLGSTQRDVKKVQGEPTSKSKDPLGTEKWHYGAFSKMAPLVSKVEFKSGRVLAWSNSNGDLKVRLVPGPKVTSKPLLSLGSHKDDVVRLQGTPRSITAYRAPSGMPGGFEFWSFGGGSVHFSSSGRVIDWENNVGSIKVLGIRPDPELAENLRSADRAMTAQGCGSLMSILGLFTAAAIAAMFLA